LCDIHKYSDIDCRYGCVHMVEQSEFGVFVNSCMIGVDCSRRSTDVTVTTSHRADLWGLQGLSNTKINQTSVSYFLLSPDLQIILPRL